VRTPTSAGRIDHGAGAGEPCGGPLIRPGGRRERPTGTG
jgi:hypothetical protein